MSSSSNRDDWVFLEEPTLASPDDASKQSAPETETLLQLLGERVLDKGDVLSEVSLENCRRYGTLEKNRCGVTLPRDR